MKSSALSASQLGGFKLIEEFRKVLAPYDQRRSKGPRELDPRRRFDGEGYFVMILFSLLNPVLDSMRGLCEASHYDRFESDLNLPPVSLGSFSEAQSVFGPDVLRGVLRELLESRIHDGSSPLRGKLDPTAIEAVDSTLWNVVNRMDWAYWRDQSTRQNAVRLHLRWRIFDVGSAAAALHPARECERRVLRHELLEPAITYVGDRNYARDYDLLERIVEVGSNFVVRLQGDAVVERLEELPISEADHAEGVLEHARVKLGWRNKIGGQWRLITVDRPGRKAALRLLTSLGLEELSAGDVSKVYRHRWQIELFFRWLKCTLKCRHWLAQSQQGVIIQVYCSLIAALLIARRRDKLPTKRQMEAIRFWLVGWITDQELAQKLQLAEKKPA